MQHVAAVAINGNVTGTTHLATQPARAVRQCRSKVAVGKAGQLSFLAMLGLSLCATSIAPAQHLKADMGGAAIDGSVTHSDVNIPPQQL